ncbi:MAG: T9SS type A sorting domain-containing protein [Bacteroidia bacterium]|nr:T9SS type A sorting domain-containing protein [Bacteroidia bacterium]MDW8333516.1 T9SS type A sorting domain-containing protein [Bacteroidia bacterium]
MQTMLALAATTLYLVRTVCVCAQDVVAERYVIGAAAASRFTGEFYVSFTAGQTVGGTAEATGTVFTQGFQQTLLENPVSRVHVETSEVSVYPNPTQDAFFLSGLKPGLDAKVEAFDLTGRPVALSCETNVFFFPRNIAAGVYPLRIRISRPDGGVSYFYSKIELLR